ncbi:MAG: C-terminal binding protein, partial [Brooklawnia sp.]
MRVTITDLDHDSWAVEQGVAEAEGVEFHFLGGGKDAGLDPRVKGSEGLVVQYAEITADVMDFLLPELKVVGRYGVGVDTIDLDAAEARGIVVVNVPDYGTQS